MKNITIMLYLTTPQSGCFEADVDFLPPNKL